MNRRFFAPVNKRRIPGSFNRAGALLVLCIVAFATLVGIFGSLKPELTSAAASTTLTFQARLLNTNGSLVADGTYNVEFKIYDTVGSGASLQGVCSLDSTSDDCWWLETRTGANKVTVKNGYVYANLGSVTAFSSTVPWDQELWITMNIGGTGTPTWDGEMSPRFKVAAVPYAFAAAKLQVTDSAITNKLVFATPSASNKTITLPNETGTVCTTGSICSGYASAASAFIQDGNSFGTTATLGTNDSQSLVLETAGSARLTVTSAGDATFSGDLAVNGGDLTTSQTTFNLLNVTATTVNAFGVATAINLGAAAGSTITPAGNLTFAEAAANGVTLQSSLASAGRTTSLLTLTQANDATNNASSTGYLLNVQQSDVATAIPVVNITNASTTAGSAALNISNSNTSTTGEGILVTGVAGANVRGVRVNGVTTGIGFVNIATTSGTGIQLGGAITSGTGILFDTTTNGFTSGKALNISGAASAITADFSGSYIFVTPTRTLTAAATRTESGNFLTLTRANTTNGASSIMNITGDLATLSSTCTQTLGTCTDTSNILQLTQSYATATGEVLRVDGAGTGNLATLDATAATANGALIDIQSSSVSQYALKVTTNNAGTAALQINGDGSVSLGATGVTTTNNGALTATQLLTGSLGLTVSGGTASINATGTSASTIGNATGTLTLTGNSSSTFVLNGTTLSAAELNLLDGHDVALVDTNDAVATAIVGTGALNAGSITSGFGAIDIGADTITSGAINSQTISSAANFTGTLAVNGASVTVGTASATTGTLVLQNATNAFTTTITAPNTTVSSKTITLPNETGTVCTTGSVCSGYQASVTGGAANQQLSNLSGTIAINLALLPGADNTIDLGSVAASFRTLYADTSVLTLAVDTPAAGTLSLGTSTATAVTLGKAGITTTNTGALTSNQLFTGILGATISGATINLNATSNFATNINTGTSSGAIALGNSAAGVITLQSASTIGLTGTSTITGLSAGSGTALTVNNSTSTGNVFVAQDNATAVFTVADGGSALFRNSANSVTALQVQNSAGTTNVLTVDTSNVRVGIGTATPDAKLDIEGTAGTELVRLSNTTTSDSSGIFSGSGSPEGSVTAQIGSLYTDTTFGKVYKKGSGDGTNTGWEEFAAGSGTNAAKMTRAAAQTIPDVTVTKLAFDTEVYDVGDIADSVTNDRFVIKKAGKYLVTSFYYTNYVFGGYKTFSYIYKNGVGVIQGVQTGDATYDDNAITTTTVLDLAVNDYIEMYVYQHTGAARNTLTTAGRVPEMTVTQLDAAGGGNPEVGARAYNTVAQTIPTTTTTALTFDSERFDTSNIHSTSSNTSRLTAPTRGKYLITGSVMWVANASVTRRITNICLNGTSTFIARSETTPAASTNIAQNVATVYELNAGDYVELCVYQPSGGNIDVAGNDTGSNMVEFTMNKIDGGVNSTLQAAYNSGNTLTTTDARNIQVTLADTTTDQTLEVTQAGTALALRVNDDGTFTDTTPFVVDASGNVGIGLTAPSSKLHIVGAGSAGAVVEALRLDNSEGAFGAGAGTGLGFYYSSSAKQFGSINTLAYAGNGGSSDMTFSVRTSEAISEKMRILANGNVGIGTTAPLLRIDVAGSGRFTGAATTVLTGSIDAIASTTVTGVGTLFLTELVVGDRITVTGETRTVTAIASNLSLTVDTATTDTANDTSPDKLAAALVVRDSSSIVKLVVNNLGYAGIGTSAPSTNLEVGSITSPNGIYVRQRTDSATVSGNIFLETSTGVLSVRGNAGALSFLTGATVGSSSGTERFNISTAGASVTGTLLVSGVTTLSSALVTIAGTSNTAQAIYFTGDSDTGWWSPGADQFRIVAGGTEIVSYAAGVAYIGGGYTNMTVNMDLAAQQSQRVCHGGTDGANKDNVGIGDCLTGGADLAEFYNTNGNLEPGDVVYATGSDFVVDKTNSAYQSTALGVVSTNPIIDGFLGNELSSPDRQPIALSGRVPVKVSLENGPIHIGDYLAPASTPGFVMKASVSGRVVGIALEDYEGTGPRVSASVSLEETRRTNYHAGVLSPYTSNPNLWPSDAGKIMMFLNPTFYTASSVAALQGTSLEINGNSVFNGDASTAGTLTVENIVVNNNLTVSGNTTLTNLRVTGNTEVANLTVNGKIITAGNTPTVVLGATTTGDGSSYSIEGNDTAGSITITSGTSTVANPLTAGEQAVMTFVTPFTTTPRITITPTTEAAANIKYFITKSGTQFKLHFTTAPDPNSTYSFDYQVIQ